LPICPTARLPQRSARLESRIMRLETSGYIAITPAVAIAMPAAIPITKVAAFILLTPFKLYMRLVSPAYSEKAMGVFVMQHCISRLIQYF
jgi:hypothetical protein